jgi:hypothetical protein
MQPGELAPPSLVLTPQREIMSMIRNVNQRGRQGRATVSRPGGAGTGPLLLPFSLLGFHAVGARDHLNDHLPR